ncbi:unnamed protein product [Rhizophagus irregularis]|nr:unnamed protein product [Rhizophagus irregularis]
MECSCVFVTCRYQATPEFTNMDNTENTEFSADDFTSLFDSNGLFKDKLEGFNENQKKLRSLNEKAKDVQEENLKLKNEVKAWVNRKGQIKLAQSNIDNSYPSEVPPKGKEDDKTYQESIHFVYNTTCRYQATPEFTNMDNTENTEFSADDFTSLFDSNGLFKDKLEGFNENQKKLRSLNEKAKDVQEENLKLKNEVKAWVNRKGQIKLAQSNIDNSYPSEVPPKGKEDDKTYQERYAIAKEFISGWRTCIDEFEDYQKKCDEFGKLFEETTQKNKDNINKTLSKLSKLSKLSLPGGSFHPLIYRLFKHSYHTKSQGCCNLGFFSK